MTGPSSGVVGVASSVFTVGANGNISGSVTVTPNDSSGGGAFSPASVAISSSAPTATFTYTAGSAGTKTVGATNDGGLSNPTPMSYAASTPGSYSLQIGPGYMMAGSTKLVSIAGQWTAWQTNDIGTLGTPTLNGSGVCDTNGVWTISGLPAAGTTRVLIKNTAGTFVGYWVGNAA